MLKKSLARVVLGPSLGEARATRWMRIRRDERGILSYAERSEGMCDQFHKHGRISRRSRLDSRYHPGTQAFHHSFAGGRGGPGIGFLVGHPHSVPSAALPRPTD